MRTRARTASQLRTLFVHAAKASLESTHPTHPALADMATAYAIAFMVGYLDESAEPQIAYALREIISPDAPRKRETGVQP